MRTLSSARAIATRCRSPPLRLSPRSPTRVLYPLGIRAAVALSPTRPATSRAASSLDARSPYLRLYLPRAIKGYVVRRAWDMIKGGREGRSESEGRGGGYGR